MNNELWAFRAPLWMMMRRMVAVIAAGPMALVFRVENQLLLLPPNHPIPRAAMPPLLSAASICHRTGSECYYQELLSDIIFPAFLSST